MRVIFEEVDREYYLEIILNLHDIDRIKEDSGLSRDFKWPSDQINKINVFVRKGSQHMPLVKGEKAKTKEGFSENVRREIESGKSQKEAVAIAYSEARQGKKKGKK